MAGARTALRIGELLEHSVAIWLCDLTNLISIQVAAAIVAGAATARTIASNARIFTRVSLINPIQAILRLVMK